MTGANNKLTAFILLSLGVHALLLAPNIGKQITATVTPSLGTLSINLESASKKPAHIISKKLQKTSASSEKVHSISPYSSTQPRNTVNKRSQRAVSSLATNQIKLKVMELLKTHFEYPLMAVRHGWQGNVELRFRILANGTLTNIQVAHSSGYTLLDQSAVEALRRIHQIQDSEHWLRGQDLDMTVPISYQLKEG